MLDVDVDEAKQNSHSLANISNCGNSDEKEQYLFWRAAFGIGNPDSMTDSKRT